MPNYFCPHCEANNSEPGQCVMCLKSIGRPRQALKAALNSTVLLILMWIFLTVFVGLQHPIVAIGFGGVVAFCTSYFSGGKGIYYQAIATGFTAFGIVVAEVLSQIVLQYREGKIDLASVNLSDIWNNMLHFASYDPITVLFYVLGVMGSFCIWR